MKLRYLSDVTTLAFDQSRCTGCARCVEVCPHGVFTMENKHAKLVDRDACIECGACMKNCAFGAIAVRAGVGCAAAVLGSFRNKGKPQCGPSTGGSCCG